MIIYQGGLLQECVKPNFKSICLRFQDHSCLNNVVDSRIKKKNSHHNYSALLHNYNYIQTMQLMFILYSHKDSIDGHEKSLVGYFFFHCRQSDVHKVRVWYLQYYCTLPNRVYLMRICFINNNIDRNSAGAYFRGGDRPHRPAHGTIIRYRLCA